MEHQLSMNLEWQTREILLIGWLPTVIVVHNWCHCRAVWLRSLAAGCSIDQPTLLYIRVCLKLRGTPQRRRWIGTICKSCWNAKYTIILKFTVRALKWCFRSWEKRLEASILSVPKANLCCHLSFIPRDEFPKRLFKLSTKMSPVALSAVKFALQPNEHLFDNGSPLSGTLW